MPPNTDRILALLTAVAVLAPSACTPDESAIVRFTGAAMGTTWSVQLAARPGVEAGDLQADMAAVLHDIDAHMSTYREDSEVVRFNRSTSAEWFPVSVQTATVVAAAIDVSEQSGGAFDVTLLPLVELWGFGAAGRRETRPRVDEIAAILPRIGFGHLAVQLDPPALRKRIPQLAIDLSAIAKGYAVDRLAELLDSRGLHDYLVEVGGELRAGGRNRHGDPWRVGVERPQTTGRQVERILPLVDRAIATSGGYRNFFEDGGRRYSHTLDPRTGEPIQHALVSVSVIADSAMRADALATALLVLGPSAGMELARNDDIAALFIEQSGSDERLRPSPGWQRALAQNGPRSQ